MFTSIRGALQRRQQFIRRQEGVASSAQKAVLEFLQQNHIKTPSCPRIHYQDENSTLTIITQNKTLAGELLLCTPELRSHLSFRGISPGQIIVR